MLSDKKEATYKNIAYICSLFLIFGLIFKLGNPIFDLVYDIATISTMLFVYLALRRRISLIGLGLFSIVFNIKLLVNPIMQIQNPIFFNSFVHKLTYSIFMLGFLCLIIGIMSKSEDSYFTERVQIDNRITLGIFIGLIFLTQGILRIIW